MDPLSYIIGYKQGEANGGGSGDINVVPITINENGLKIAPSGKAYSPISVNVENSYNVEDEGKVVSNSALVAQTAHAEISANGTYDTTLNNEVTVNVSGGGSAVVQPLSVTQNGTYNPPSGVDGYAPVTVNVPTGSGDILSGATVPSASLGNDGDIYKQIIPIPSNVDFVEYLESTGTQYIDTGIIPTANSSFIADFTNQAQLNIICGGRIGTGADSTYRYGVQITNTNNNFGKLILDFGTGGRTSNIQLSYGRHIAETGKIKKLDGSVISKRDFGGSYPIEDNVSVYLFAIHSSGGNTFGKSKIHRILHLENGVVTHDYLPCLDGNGVACMWENVTQQYIYNSGTGDFSYGSTVTPEAFLVYFLKKNGAWEVIQQ